MLKLPYQSILDDSSTEVALLIRASMASSTWKRHVSAWHSFEKFSVDRKIVVIWPLNEHLWGEYIVWALTVKKLKSDTVRNYLSSLKLVHTLKGISCLDPFKVKIFNMLLTGADNLQIVTGSGSNTNRKAFNLPLLKLTGHRIASSDWPLGVKQTVWAALTLGFFSGVRLGEVLSDSENRLDTSSTLLWEDVLFRKDGSILIHVKLPKIKKPEGDFLDIFEFSSSGCCPVAALKTLKQLQSEGGYTGSKLPVFCFPSGKLLTTQRVNTTLSSLLSDLSFDKTSMISCHSLRAAIPTLLAPEPESVDVCKAWGRWSSPCYRKYVRDSTVSKKKMFDKIMKSLE